MRQWRRHHSSGRLVNRSFAHHVLFNGYSIPPGVQGTEFIEGYADVLKSESCAKLLKLSDTIIQGCSFILGPPLHVWTSCSKVVGALPKVSHIDVRVCSP